MTSLFKLFASISIVAVLSGCAANVTRDSTETPKIAASDIAAKRVILSMTGPEGGNSGSDWEAFREEWQTSMTAALATTGASFSFADRLTTTTPEPAVLLKMKVNDYRYVTQAKRYAIGVFTGNAHLDIDVQFLELPSNRILGTRKYSSSSSFIHGVFAAMTPKQVEAVSKEIASELRPK